MKDSYACFSVLYNISLLKGDQSKMIISTLMMKSSQMGEDAMMMKVVL